MPVLNAARVCRHEQMRQARLVPGQSSAVDGLRGGAVLIEPDRGVGRQSCDGVGIVVFEVGPQQLPEQVVFAIPDAPVVERDDEMVRALEFGQDRCGVGSTEDGIAQRPAESIEE